MTKQEYQNRSTELEAERNLIDENIDELRQKYLESNAPCAVGDKVEVEDGNGIREKAVVIAFKINSSDEIEPMLRKVKKDGSVSFRQWIGYRNIIHYPEKVTQ